MKRSKLKLSFLKNKIYASFIIVALVFSFAYLSNTNISSMIQKVWAASTDVSGWAWTATSTDQGVGWISMNSLTDGSPIAYGVKVDDVTGDFSGYAWSENIGWINFAPTIGYPEAPNHGARIEGGTVTGWARACGVLINATNTSGFTCSTEAINPNAGDWDGWIKMSGVTSGGSNYGVTASTTGNFSGYAWGSDIMGWVDMHQVISGGTVNGIPPSEATTTSQTFTPYCVSGTVSNLQGNSGAGKWTWDCLGVNGGSSCIADALANPAIVCGVEHYTPAPALPPAINFSGTPTAISKGGSVALSWDITNPNNGCAIVASSTINTTDTTRMNELVTINLTLNTNTDSNDPSNGSSGTRLMTTALQNFAPTSLTKARGKKTITNINYPTDFILQCNNATPKKVKVSITSSVES